MSQEGNLSLVNLKTLFRRSDLSFIKLGQWSIKLRVNTLSIEAIICTVRRGSYKFQDTFLKILRLSEFRICLDCSIQLLQK